MQPFLYFGLYNDITVKDSKAKNCSSHNCERLHLKFAGFVLDFIVLLARKLLPFFKDTRVKYLAGLRTTLYNIEIFKDGAFDLRLCGLLG